MRQDDPVYDHGDAYIPSSIQVLHLWCDPDDELPWERTNLRSPGIGIKESQNGLKVFRIP